MGEPVQSDGGARAPLRRGAATTAAVVGVAIVSAGLVTSLAASDARTAAASSTAEAPAIPFFGFCPHGGGDNCVIDGNTFYYGRAKIRIANIDAPETHPPRCAEEARLGNAATNRLRDLLNSGEVSLGRIDRDEAIDGRKLRLVAVDGADVGAALVGVGLARMDAGERKSWCA